MSKQPRSLEIRQALSNWGRVMRLDMEQHGISSLPKPPVMSQQYQAPTKAFDESLPETLDEAWAERVQRAIVRVGAIDMRAWNVLVKHFRDLNKQPRDQVKWALSLFDKHYL
jgi:hypothetical protein